MNKKVSICRNHYYLVILASIAIPYTLGYIKNSKNSKEHLMASHILKVAQVMGT